MPVFADHTIRANPMIVTRQMDGGAVLMNTTNGECYELNTIGAVVWEHINRGTRLLEVIDELTTSYAVDRETLSTDVLTLVDDLARQGIVTLDAR